MSTAIEYERLTTGIVDFNLSTSEPPAPGLRGGNVPTGILAECFLGPRDSHNGSIDGNWHIHYRE
jgi:hypothetical protein